ncbi:uncharacterized protein LOC133833089 [Humulus lupulus]|uniref:uncharacterized protein LOC133833089 n=1 Tax=Humulus lupulus TaxID=3486 RepID=UPI002B416E02|nr:uncharacterized protein LOC133833089 [Humulus lupulus]
MEKSSIDLNRETSSTSVSETQPKHGVEGLENVVLHNEDESRHKGKVKWSKEDTILLISGWLNTSKDDIVGNDQTSTHFWARIVEYYNTNQKVQQAHHSGWFDEQILENAHQLYKSENSNSNFLLVDCWRLLKDEPKWNTMYQPKCGKRTKVSELGAFTSSNADINDDEVREVRPTGHKAAKRKGKEKKDTHTRFIEISERKASALEKLVAIKEKEAEDNRMTKYMDYLIVDTLHMTPKQKKEHENFSTRQGRKRAHIDSGHVEGHQHLFDDYFSDELVYTEYQFRRKFRMRRHVFLRIVQALENHSEYFHMRFDAIGRRGLSPLQKCTAAMRMLAYGKPVDYVDEYVRIGETTAIKCLVNFVWGVNDIFGTEYLRRPTASRREKKIICLMPRSGTQRC